MAASARVFGVAGSARAVGLGGEPGGVVDSAAIEGGGIHNDDQYNRTTHNPKAQRGLDQTSFLLTNPQHAFFLSH